MLQKNFEPDMKKGKNNNKISVSETKNPEAA